MEMLNDMKKLINIILADYQREGFTKREFKIYGVYAVVALMLAIVTAEVMNR